MTRTITAREKYLRRAYRLAAKPGANPVAIATAARLQTTIEEVRRQIGATDDPKLAAQLLKLGLEAENRLQRVQYSLGILIDTTARRRSRAVEKAEDSALARREFLDRIGVGDKERA